MSAKLFTKLFQTVFAVIVFSAVVTTATAQQTIIYSENFDVHIPGSFIQPGWTSVPAADTSSWHTDSSASNVSSGYPGASGQYGMVIRNTAPTNVYTLTTPAISTMGHDSINFIWGARNSTNFSASGSSIQSVQWSSDGINWNTIAYTGSASNSVWALENAGNRIYLPAAANHQPSLKIRWVANIINSSNGTYRIDDFNVKGRPDGSGVNNISSSENNFVVFGQDKNIFITNKNMTDINIRVYNLNGQQLANEMSSANNIIILAEGFAAGIYLVKIEDTLSGTLVTKKISVQ